MRTTEATRFKQGMYVLHDHPNFNFQLNRTVMWGGGDVDEVREAAKRIESLATWATELRALGEAALVAGRVDNAIGYFRMAEFFMIDGDPDKLAVYRRARSLFYGRHARVFDSVVQRRTVPYEGGQLPVWTTTPDGPIRDTILLHGGYDSYKEEFLPAALYLRAHGFKVCVFEGPGQGEVLREQGMPFTPEWERPVKRIMDALSLDDVTIVGISLGGMLAPRAAAFEQRIKRVVAWSIFPDFLEIVISTRPKAMRRAMRTLLALGARAPLNALLRRKMRTDPLLEWGLSHGMFAMGVETPFEYLLKTKALEMLDVGPAITQDFLLLGAQQDHFVPYELYKREIDALTGVRSLTFRLFSEREDAGNHCSVGNTKLVLDTVIDWIARVKGPARVAA